MAVVVVLGVTAVAFSRYERSHLPPATPPTFTDHWHEAVAFDICGKIQANLPQPTNLIGIHTHGDGLIHVEPQSSADTGTNATLGRFASGYPGLGLTSTSLHYPGQRTWTNGDKCGSIPGKVQLKTWSSLVDQKGTLVTGDPRKLRTVNGALLTIAFVPPGTNIPKPPSAANLAHPNAAGTPTAPAPGAPAPPTGAPGTPAPGTPAPGTPTTPSTGAPAAPNSGAPAMTSPGTPPAGTPVGPPIPAPTTGAPGNSSPAPTTGSPPAP